MEENAGNVFFCNQIIYENTYEKKVSCCFIDLYHYCPVKVDK